MFKELLEELILEEIGVSGYERVVRIKNKGANLEAIIAVHNTSLGSALGGIRIYPYKTFDDALTDVLRLSKGMTYKAAIAEVGLGGGKAVIIADPKEKGEELLFAMGKAVDQLNGKYICAEDVGSTTEDMAIIRRSTKYVVGLNNGSGDPSRFTARGVFRGIQSIMKILFGSESMIGRKVAIQGLGSVGDKLAEILFWEGANLIVTDIDEEKVKKAVSQYGAKAVGLNEIFEEECDIFAPCAMGGILNDGTIPKLRCRAIGGCANNQLLEKRHASLLKERNILYAPDYVINAGGLINVSFELLKEGYSAKKAKKKVDTIYESLLDIFTIAEKQGVTTSEAADALAEHKIRYSIGKRALPLYFS